MGQSKTSDGPYEVPTSATQLCNYLAEMNNLTMSDELAECLSRQPLKVGWHLLTRWYKGGSLIPNHMPRYRIATLATTLISVLTVMLKYGRILDSEKKSVLPLWTCQTLDLVCEEPPAGTAFSTLRSLYLEDGTLRLDQVYKGTDLVLDRMLPITIDQIRELLPSEDGLSK